MEPIVHKKYRALVNSAGCDWMYPRFVNTKQFTRCKGDKMAKRKRKATPAQLRALAKGRRALAARRRGVVRKVKRRKVSARRYYGSPRSRTVTRIVRRQSGKMVGPSVAVMLGVGGGVLAGVGANMLPIQDPRVRAIIPAIAGIAMAAFVPNRTVKAIGVGAATIGGASMVRQFFPQVPVLAGDDPNPAERFLGVPENTGGRLSYMGVPEVFSGPVRTYETGSFPQFRTSADF